MNWLIVVFAFLWLIEGITGIFWSKQFKTILETTLPELPIKSVGVLIGFLSIGIVYGSHSCRIHVPVFIVGSIVLVKGLSFIILPETWIRRLITWWITHIPEWFYKIWGICMLGLGALFLYCR